jgi:hypothetical protein
MHVIMFLETHMRTTVEIRDEHRAILLEMAARRGEKGFSTIVAEAIELLIQARGELDAARRRALGLRGTMAAKDADSLRREAERLRSEWR